MRKWIVHALCNLLLMVVMMSACKQEGAVERLRLQPELERAVLADQMALVNEEGKGEQSFQAFLKRHGEDAVPLFEKLVADAAKSGDGGNPSLIEAAVDGLVFLRKGDSRELLKGLAYSDKVGFELSRSALDALIEVSPSSERVGVLVERLRQRQEPQDQFSTVDDLIKLASSEAVPHLKEIRPGISDAKTARHIDKAIALLGEPGVCRVYGEKFREETRRWGCVYRCAGPVRSRERVMESGCPSTIANQDE